MDTSWYVMVVAGSLSNVLNVSEVVDWLGLGFCKILGGSGGVVCVCVCVCVCVRVRVCACVCV